MRLLKPKAPSDPLARYRFELGGRVPRRWFKVRCRARNTWTYVYDPELGREVSCQRWQVQSGRRPRPMTRRGRQAAPPGVFRVPPKTDFWLPSGVPLGVLGLIAAPGTPSEVLRAVAQQAERVNEQYYNLALRRAVRERGQAIPLLYLESPHGSRAELYSAWKGRLIRVKRHPYLQFNGPWPPT